MYNTIFDRMSETELRKIVSSATSIAQVFHEIGLCCSSGQYKSFKRRVNELNIDISHFKGQYSKTEFSIEIPVEKTFVKGTFRSGNSLKNKIKKYGLIEYKCQKCSNNGNWNNKKLSLQLDHIDGDNKNNELTNLRFLCPNCHSQTENYSGKKLIKRYFCQDCGIKISSKKSKKCLSCASKGAIKTNPMFKIIENWPTNEELATLVFQQPLTNLGKTLGISSNGIKARCKRNNIPLPPQGFWQRIRAGLSLEEAIQKKTKRTNSTDDNGGGS